MLDDDGEVMEDWIAEVELGRIEFATEYCRAGSGAQPTLGVLMG